MKLPDMREAQKRTSKEIVIKTNEYIVKENLKELGLGKKYYIKTYGCQMNVHDSENIKAILEDMSFTETDVFEDADIILLNTCAIRENAHNKVFGFLGRVKHLKQSRPHIICGVCGCMAQEESVVDEIKNKYRWVDIVFGTHNIHNLPNILAKSLERKEQEIEVFSVEGDVLENIPVKRDSKYKAWVNIMYGCDKFCTYCIVPYTRGKQRSRRMEDILSEVRKLKEDNFMEVTLLGQNVNAYGKDLNEGYDLSDLLLEVSKIGLPRVRFITSHPWDFTDKMIEVIKNNKNIMPYIHLPLQSGSDKILKLMGRRYTRESYKELFNKLKEIDGVSITTDIIVGFPGETEEDFNDTLDMVNYCKYDGAFTFIFSPRVGTPAEKLMEKDNLTMKEKEDRLHKLNEIINNYSLESNKKMEGKTYKVLVEGDSIKEDELFGYTETSKLVNFKGNRDLIGKVVDVKITSAKSFSLDGEVVE